MNKSSTLSDKKRVPSLDRFRGFALCLMIIFGAAQAFVTLPVLQGLSTHDLTKAILVMPSLAFYDLIAPLFVFACGLGLGLSENSTDPFRRSSASGFLYRVISLIGLGAAVNLPSSDALSFVFLAFSVIALTLVLVWLLGNKVKRINKPLISRVLHIFIPFVGIFAFTVAVCENVVLLCGNGNVPSSHWSVLASIGIAMLISYPVARSRTVVKLVVCAAYTALYYFAVKFIPRENFIHFTHGGLLGSFGWGLMCVYAVTLADLRKINIFLTPCLGAILCVLGFIFLEKYLPLKSAVNLTYVLITSALGCLIFSFFEIFNGYHARYAPLSDAGKNSLFMYLIHLICFVPCGTVIYALVMLIPLNTIFQTIISFIGLIGYFLLFSFLMKKLNIKGFRLKV